MARARRRPTGPPKPRAPLQIEQVPIEDLAKRAAPYNPRTITEQDMESLRRSLRVFGVVDPIVVNRTSGNIIGGHQRVQAAQAESFDSLPVVWVDLDESGERQLNLALNRISGDWDSAMLRDVLIDLEGRGADLELTGFSVDELDRLFGEDESKAPGDGDGDGSGVEAYRVIVTCLDENDQAALINRMEAEGRKAETFDRD